MVFEDTSVTEFAKESRELGYFSFIDVFPEEYRKYGHIDSSWIDHFSVRAHRKLHVTVIHNDSTIFVYTRPSGEYKKTNNPVYYITPKSYLKDSIAYVEMEVFWNLNSENNLGNVKCIRYKLIKKKGEWIITFIESRSNYVDLVKKREILLSDLLVQYSCKCAL